jgi:CDP-diacylglycerol---serine O-phosphatidyltransferase
VRRPRFLFVLPNLFTVSSIFCGMYAMVLTTEGQMADRFYRAAVAILFGILFDAADGRVARLTKTESNFGVQLDSLADAISFGVAPAFLVYKWALFSMGFLGLLAAFVFASCGAIRLARFNVMAARNEGVPRYFLGLPIPLAAAGISSIVLLNHHLGNDPVRFAPYILGLVLLLSFLMVSHVRYRTFKKLRLNGRMVLLIAFLAGSLVVVSWVTRIMSFSFIFTSAWIAFVAFGLIEELVRVLRMHGSTVVESDDKNKKNAG